MSEEPALDRLARLARALHGDDGAVVLRGGDLPRAAVVNLRVPSAGKLAHGMDVADAIGRLNSVLAEPGEVAR